VYRLIAILLFTDKSLQTCISCVRVVLGVVTEDDQDLAGPPSGSQVGDGHGSMTSSEDGRGAEEYDFCDMESLCLSDDGSDFSV